MTGAPSPHAAFWTLEPTTRHLNHGSFGACPRPVLAVQQALRDELEADPMRFLARELDDRLDGARAKLAAFLGANPNDLVWVSNATAGVNTVLASLDWAPGDELLTTNQVYPACYYAMVRHAERRGAKVVVAPVPFPVADPQELVDAVLAHVTPRTRLALLDHVTSATALIFPIADLVAALAARGVDTLVDGAHAPGQVPVAVDALGAAYYAGNCHKWLCAPKGSGFLHIRADRQDAIVPLVTSHGAGSRGSTRPRLHREFDWTGTWDPTAYLAVPAALEFMATLEPGGWAGLRAANHALAVAARAVLCDTLNLQAPCPEAMIGAMATVFLPDGEGAAPDVYPARDAVQNILATRYRTHVPVFSWPAWPKRCLRVSAQRYNTLSDYQGLATDLVEALALTNT